MNIYFQPKIRLLFLIILMIFIISCKPQPAETNVTYTQNNVQLIIKSVSKRPPESGYLRTWVVITAVNTSNVLFELYLPYFEENQDIPIVGEVCSISFQEEKIEGFSSNGNIETNKPLLVVSKIVCSAS